MIQPVTRQVLGFGQDGWIYPMTISGPKVHVPTYALTSGKMNDLLVVDGGGHLFEAWFSSLPWRDRVLSKIVSVSRPIDVAFRHLRDVSTEELSRMARLSVFCQEKFWSAGGECSQLMSRLRHINGIDDIAKILGLEKSGNDAQY